MRYSIQKPRSKIEVILLLFIAYLFTVLCLIVITPHRTHAAPVNGFNAGNIIDDFVFTNSNTMNVSQIQSFLESKVPICDTWGTGGSTPTARRDYIRSKGYDVPLKCMVDYQENGKSGAQIVYDAAQEFQINPQVLLVLLEKEQSLITDDWPGPWQFKTATGYGCPDTAACDSQYFGLTNQVRWAARMYRAILNNSPTWYTPYVLGNNYIKWNPVSSCGGSTVNIENRATQALYNYTPYQPNQSALNAGYGMGDSCSSYGNRNFFLYFSDWFGSVRANDTTKPHPDGTLVNIDNAVYILQNGTAHHLTNGTVFETRSYRWQDIKPATTGDRQLPRGTPISNIPPGVLYRSEGTSIFRSVIEGSQWAKEVISYSSFISLGYNWSQVRVVPTSHLPIADASTIYTLTRHPDGALINDAGAVYYIENGTRRYVTAAVFGSYRWIWSDVTPATSADKLLPLGTNMTLRTGAVASNKGNLYIIDSSEGLTEKIRPIGPWTCYANVFKYSPTDVIPISDSDLPASIGPIVTC